VGVALGRSTDAVVALALGDVVAPPSAPAGLALVDGRPAVAVGTGWFDAVAVGAARVGVPGLVAGVVGIAVGDAVAVGDGAGPSRTGDGTGRGRVLELVLAPAGPTGETG
jgi:hypothetical protein